MKYLSKLSNDEIRYICSIIPLHEAVCYFKSHPTSFAKVMPGFRPTSIKNQNQLSSLLYRFRNNRFISSFIELMIECWLDQIQGEVMKIINKGYSKEKAWIHVLPDSYFYNNVNVYFKLMGEELEEQYMVFISTSIIKIKELNDLIKKQELELSRNKSKVIQLEENIEKIQKELDKSSKKLIDRLNEIEELKNTCVENDRLKEIICGCEKEIEILENKLIMKNEHINKLKEELAAAIESKNTLEIMLKEQPKVNILEEQILPIIPKYPKDIREFKDFLGYNLENIGVSTSADYYFLLIEYISNILFQGKPIIINRSTGIMLMKCIANTLIGSKHVVTLSYTSEITEKHIENFLSGKYRICCLDNFIGNFNETTLATICDRHKEKIIFLTINYDRTLFYIAEEFHKYCNYINLNRIEAFSRIIDLTEEPSFIEEIELQYPINTPDSRWASFFGEILDELGYCKSLSVYKSTFISDETILCCYLAFDVLPFCIDVAKISPFNKSTCLNKYIDDRGRCLYKDLFRRWFM